VRQGEQILEGLEAHIRVRAAVETGEANAAIGRKNVGQHRVADFERVRARDGNIERDFRTGIERLKHVRQAPAPASLRDLIGHRGLPLDRLIGVRKKLRRNGGAACEILGAGDRRDQRADVRDEAEFPLIKQVPQLDEIRMKPEIPAIAVLQGERQKGRLRNGENAASGRVRSVTGVVVRNDDVVRVIATEEEKTDERLVIGGIERSRAEPAQIEDGVENAGGRERGAGGLADETAAGSRRGHNYLSTRNSGELTTR
jgi:hypothetical protein